MSKARYVADLLADSGDVKATKLDEFGALKDLSNVGTLPAALQSQLVGPAGPLLALLVLRVQLEVLGRRR